MVAMIGKRYVLHEQLGSGGMGSVYRATDRLTGHVVALKQVLTTTDRLHFSLSRPVSSYSDSISLRLSLAGEFRVLSSLRHPNIISVLDYGFDDSLSQPFFTMELLENPLTITEAGHGLPINAKIDLMIQLLHALTYLHRRGIIHRDLKPSNVLVNEGVVKTLDFGLSIGYDDKEPGDSTTAGTLAYMAPEVLLGTPAGEASDLYAVGVMLYEVLAGFHPFDDENPAALINNIFERIPDYSTLPHELAEVIQRLLAKSPDDRYTSASDVIAALSYATGQPAPEESATIRESFLQAAQLVGREEELSLLAHALETAIDGYGSAWLVGGESGVGKSRLLDELRALALVNGALVLRGQAGSESSALYTLWRAALRWLVMLTQVTDAEASVIKAIVPDITDLLERPIPDAPELPPQQANERLLGTIITVFKRQQQPIVFIVEDLHWANESLDILHHLNAVAPALPLMVVGSYRDDERPDLPEKLKGMQLIKLKRLSKAATARLSEAMLGNTGRQLELVELLHRETEGNVFFIVEVVRALAEEAGKLEYIGLTTLPQHVFAGGVQTIVQRRLERVPQEARPLLWFAAVAGRLIDLDILRGIAAGELGKALFSRRDLDAMLAQCADAAVLEVQDGKWRFAHDKLREGVLSELTKEERSTVHREVALSIERVYGDEPEQIPTLAYHWQMGEVPPKTAHYATLAGDLSMSGGSYHDAAAFYLRALENLPQDGAAMIDVTLKLNSVSTYSPPENMLEMLESALTLAETLDDGGRYVRVLGSIGAYYHGRGQTVLANSYFERCIELGEQMQLEEVMVLPYNIIGRTRTVIGDFPSAMHMLEKGIPLAEKFNDMDVISSSMAYYGQTLFILGHPVEALSYARRAIEISEQRANRDRIAADLATVGWGLTFGGQFDRAIPYLERSLQIAYDIHVDLPLITASGCLGYICLKQGDIDQAYVFLERCLQEAAARKIMFHFPLYEIYRAEVDLRNGDLKGARQIADEAYEIAEGLQQNIAFSEYYILIGKIFAASQEWDRAAVAIQEGIRLHRDFGRLTFIADAMFELGKVFLARGDSPQAAAALNKAMHLFEQLGMTWHLGEVRKLMPLASSR